MTKTVFSYTKADGKVSSRSLIVLVETEHYLEGYDVSQLPNDEQNEVDESFNNVIEDYKAGILTEKQYTEDILYLADVFDLKNNYRKFLTKNITNRS